MESIKTKIEHKYLYGEDLNADLSRKAVAGAGADAVGRAGMIREVNSIPAQRAPAHHRAGSV